MAFSGEPEYGGKKVTEASLNGFPSGQIADKIQEDPYRFLICADKFQTDPNKLHDLKAALDDYQVYGPGQIDQLVELYLGGADRDRLGKLITEDIPNRVAADTAYQNARKQRDKQNARIEHDKALARAMDEVFKDDIELYRLFIDDEGFRRWMTDKVFGLTYDQPAAP